MKALIVSVNSKQLCTAGIGAEGVLTSSISWVGRLGSGNFHMHVGGLDTATNQHLNWPVRELAVSDEVVTRIVETEAVDDPISSRTRAELEAEFKEAQAVADRGGSSSIEAALILFDSNVGDWEPQRTKQFRALPRIGERVAVEVNGNAVMARIVMVAHSEESSVAGGVNLYAVVEGKAEECLKTLARSF